MRMQVKTRHGPQMNDCVLRLIAQHVDGAAGQPPRLPHSQHDHASAHHGNRREEFGSAVQVDRELMPEAFAAGERRPSSATDTCAGPPLPQRGHVQLGIKDSGLAPGQFAAFYLGEECLGSGVINGPSATAAVNGSAVTKTAGGYAVSTNSNRGGGQEGAEEVVPVGANI